MPRRNLCYDHRSLVIEQYGEPSDNVKLQIKKPEEIIPHKLGPTQVLYEHLAACVNPADLNLAQGVYGHRPPLPTILGNEGIGIVRETGDKVTQLKEGDLAIGVSLIGYWQSYSIQEENTLFKLKPDLEITTGAQLKVNPATAYRMTKDFYDLKPGDTIIQNGANSAVGVYTIQLAKLWGYKTINVIRDRPNKDEIVKELKDFGADHVITEAEVSNADRMRSILKDTGRPKLFLNCVGGRNAMDCQRSLEIGGYSVTYGAMSRQPFSVSATSLIFKDHKFFGFWVSRWYQEREGSRRHEVEAFLDELSGLFQRGHLKPKSSTLIDFENRNTAFSGSNNTKYIFSINKR